MYVKKTKIRAKFLSTLTFNKHTKITICAMKGTADIKSEGQTDYLMKRQFHP